MIRTVTFLALMAIPVVTAVAQPAASIDAEALATTPAVQTAEWAVEWWSDRHAAKLAERDAALAAGEKINVVFLGDSITHGWENAGAELWSKHFAPMGALNLGFSGDRTEQVLWRLGCGDAGEGNNEIAGITPKAFVVMIGTNNAGHRQEPAEATAAGVTAIVDRLQACSPESTVLLLAIFPRGATIDDPLRRLNAETNRLIAELAQRDGVEWLDINEVFLDEEGDLPTDVMPDLLHPNEAGYALWADALRGPLKKIVGAVD